MSILVLFIVGASCCWRAEKEGPPYPKTVWLPLDAKFQTLLAIGLLVLAQIGLYFWR